MKPAEMMVIHDTTQALTKGIRRVNVRPGQPPFDQYVHPFGECRTLTLGVNAFHTEGGAKEAAEAMRKKKIASLRRQIARLESLTF